MSNTYPLDLWAGLDEPLPVEEPPLSEREELFAWGKAHGFPEIFFDIRHLGGGMPKGEARWQEILTAKEWKHGWMTSQMWFDCAIKFIRNEDNHEH